MREMRCEKGEMSSQIYVTLSRRNDCEIPVALPYKFDIKQPIGLAKAARTIHRPYASMLQRTASARNFHAAIVAFEVWMHVLDSTNKHVMTTQNNSRYGYAFAMQHGPMTTIHAGPKLPAFVAPSLPQLSRS